MSPLPAGKGGDSHDGTRQCGTLTGRRCARMCICTRVGVCLEEAASKGSAHTKRLQCGYALFMWDSYQHRHALAEVSQ